MHCNHAQQQWKPWFASLLWGMPQICRLRADQLHQQQMLFDCTLTTVAMAATAFNISKTEYSCLWWKKTYFFGIQTLIKCLLWKHVFLFVSVHWKQQQSNIEGRFERQVAKLLIHSLESGLMPLCAFISPLYLAKHTLCAAFDIWSCFQRVIGYSIEYLLFKNKSKRLSSLSA